MLLRLEGFSLSNFFKNLYFIFYFRVFFSTCVTTATHLIFPCRSFVFVSGQFVPASHLLPLCVLFSFRDFVRNFFNFIKIILKVLNIRYFTVFACFVLCL